MNFKNERLIESMKAKDIIRSALEIEPMSYSEMLVKLNYSAGELTNHMTQLKKHGFVKYSDDEKLMPKKNRKYYFVPGMPSYAELMDRLRKANYQMGWKDAHKSEVSKIASIVVTADQYHTHGNRSKISAWYGYQSMAGL